ncbi:uncharacterized protein LOC110385307 isoform X2 [Bombyx mori]|uniref:Uncharacterized protein n=1 Tax=Bombyx mori TaxID=7091 RepID=A0A8R2HR70_BOMMO|nr:uncharacterized protein LOC110385307 isoform X2 [Bombyx mori]
MHVLPTAIQPRRVPNTHGELANVASVKINSDDKSDSIFFVVPKEPGFDSHLSSDITYVVKDSDDYEYDFEDRYRSDSNNEKEDFVINDIINANRHGFSHEVDHPKNVPNYFTVDNVKHNTESANDDAAYILYHLLRNTNNNDHSDFKEAKDSLRSALRARCQKVEHCVRKCQKKQIDCPINCKESYDEFNICPSEKPKGCKKTKCGRTLPPNWL